MLAAPGVRVGAYAPSLSCISVRSSSWLLPLACRHAHLPRSLPCPFFELLPISLLNSTEAAKSSPTSCFYHLVNPWHLPLSSETEPRLPGFLKMYPFWASGLRATLVFLPHWLPTCDLLQGFSLHSFSAHSCSPPPSTHMSLPL